MLTREAAHILEEAGMTLAALAPADARRHFGAQVALLRQGTVRVQAIIAGKATGASVLRAEMLRGYQEAFRSAGWLATLGANAVEAHLPARLRLNGHTLAILGQEDPIPARAADDQPLFPHRLFRCSTCGRRAPLPDFRTAACARAGRIPTSPSTRSKAAHKGETTLDRITRLTEELNALPLAPDATFDVIHTCYGLDPQPIAVTLRERLPGAEVNRFAAGLITLGHYTAVEYAEQHRTPRLIALGPGRRDVVGFIPSLPVAPS
jgi:hypothetical protein